MAHRQEQHLLRIWNEVTTDHENKSTEWLIAMTLDIYNNSYPNDPADVSDLMDALERASG